MKQNKYYKSEEKKERFKIIDTKSSTNDNKQNNKFIEKKVIDYW